MDFCSVLVTDHKPLATLLGLKNAIPPLAAVQLQHWAMLCFYNCIVYCFSSPQPLPKNDTCQNPKLMLCMIKPIFTVLANPNDGYQQQNQKLLAYTVIN